MVKNLVSEFNIFKLKINFKFFFANLKYFFGYNTDFPMFFLQKKQVFLSKELQKKRLTHFYDIKLGIAQRLLQFDIY